MAPTIAVPEMLKRNGLSLQDFDLYEIHEAFAAQVLCTLRAWESEDYCRTRLGLDAPLGKIDPAKLNINGSSLATGHPFAATGARIVATAAKELQQRGGGRCLVSICTAGRSDEHTSELQSLMRTPYASFCLITTKITNYS